MTRVKLAPVVAVTAFVLAMAAGYRGCDPAVPNALAPAQTASPPTAATTPPTTRLPSTPADQGFIHGRITTVDGAVHEGRLRWGGGREEAFWGDAFNGSKHENPWLGEVPAEWLEPEREPIEVFGIQIAERTAKFRSVRPFMACFGDVVRLEAAAKQVWVTLESGTRYELDRFEASDLDDDVRVWDDQGGVVDVASLRIRTIDLLPTPGLRDPPSRLQGTVRTTRSDFTGFVAWNRDDAVGSDELDGRTADGHPSLRLDTVRSIEHRAADTLVTLADGREVVFQDRGETSNENRGIQVDDPRYGRVLIPWAAFERVDFVAGDSGPAYSDFPPGRPLAGTVTTRDGRTLTGRLVYDLDESETTDTLDAPLQGVSYSLPFARLAVIEPPGPDAPAPALARVTLQSGEVLPLEPAGDLGDQNGGLLVFVDGRERAEYVPWSDVRRVELERPSASWAAPASPRGAR
jgi:hypothetical protein